MMGSIGGGAAVVPVVPCSEGSVMAETKACLLRKHAIWINQQDDMEEMEYATYEHVRLRVYEDIWHGDLSEDLPDRYWM